MTLKALRKRFRKTWHLSVLLCAAAAKHSWHRQAPIHATRVQSRSCVCRAGCLGPPSPRNMDFKPAFSECFNLVHFDEIDSTQKWAHREFDSLPKDKLTVISADYQTAGVGKGDRKWQAAAGKSVLVTFVFHFPEQCDNAFTAKNAKNVTHILALSAIKVLRGVFRPQQEQRASFGSDQDTACWEVFGLRSDSGSF